MTIFVLEIDNYYDVQMYEMDKKVAKVVTFFLKGHALKLRISNKVQKPKVVVSLTWDGFKEWLIIWFTL